jgi:hypothetical protein
MERRKSERLKVEGVTASYWTGAAPCPQPVREIGMAGGLIETEDAYYPGTLMRLGFEWPAGGDAGGPLATFGLWARVVRKVPEGICVEFVFEDQLEVREFSEFIASIQRRDEPANPRGQAPG